MSQLETFIHESGAGTTYEARKAAPRTGNPNPNIFHFRKNLAQELHEKSGLMTYGSKVISVKDIPSEKRENKIKEFLEYRKNVLKSPESIQSNWKNILGELEDIVSDFNNSLSINVLTNTPWRVWGEVKRHRTMRQTSESIYNAADRTKKTKRFGGNLETEQVLSMPPALKKNSEATEMWVSTFENSMKTYFNLLEMGAKKSDAIAVVPRGLKLAVLKEFDLYNLTTGYSPLRLCGTAEPEMKSLTEKEMQLIKNEKAVGEDVKKLIGPKCHAVGFCPELSFSRSCGKIKQINPDYDEKIHKELQNLRIKKIKERLP